MSGHERVEGVESVTEEIENALNELLAKYGKETITDYTLSSVVGDPSIVSTSGNTIKALNTGETNVVFAVSYLGFSDEVSIKIKVI